MLLQLSTWPEVEAYLRSSRGVVLPIGSTEQHGPTGLIGTDAICAEVIAHGAGERADAMVGPTIGVGMAQHHMAFPGSMTLKPSTLVLVIRDYVLSLVEHGFERFLFVNGHGGNIPTIRAAFYEIYADLRATQGDKAPDVRLRLVSWWESDAVAATAKALFGDREGSHATPSEVSVTQFAYPRHLKTAPLNPTIAPSGGFHDARDFRRRYPDGRIGSDPALASPEHGQRLFDTASAAMADAYREMMAEA